MPNLDHLSPVKRRLLEKLLADKQPADPRVVIHPAKPPIVPLRSRGTRAPLVCVHPILGVVFPYFALSAAMRTDHPFYAISAFDEAGMVLANGRMQDDAATYLRHLKRVQPEGPYYLCGWSFGAMCAYEMARQLVEAGDEVAVLALVDTWAPGAGRLTDVVRFGSSLVRDIWGLAHDYVDLRGLEAAASGRLPRRVGDWVRRLSGSTTPPNAREQVDADAALPDTETLLRAYHRNSLAVFRYRPRPYPGRVVLFRTGEAEAHADDPSWGWGRLAAGGVELRRIEGNHMNVMTPPHVNELARQLSELLAALDDEPAR